MFIPKSRLLSIFIAFLSVIYMSACSDGSSSGKGSDKTHPEVSSALVNNNAPNKIYITFSEQVEIDNSDGFTVDAVKSKVGVPLTGQVSGSGNATIILALSRNITAYEAVTLSYNSAGNVADLDGNPLEEFSACPVINSVLPDVTPPQFKSASVEELAPSVVVAVFNESLVLTDAAGFTISINLIDYTQSSGITNISGSGTPVIKFTLSSAVVTGDIVTIAYSTADGGDARDLSDNYLASFPAKNVVNKIGPPLFVSASVSNAAPSIVDVVFNEAVTLSDAAGFIIDVEGEIFDESDGIIGVSGSGIAYIRFTLSTPVGVGDDVFISYDNASMHDNVTDIAGNPLATFGPEAVTNNVTTHIGDAYEVNDDLESAYDLTLYENILLSSIGGYATMSDGDDDYYMISVPDGQMVNISLIFDSNLDTIYFTLKSSAGGDMCYSEYDGNGTSELSYVNNTGSTQTWYIYVGFMFSGSDEQSYDLIWDCVGAPADDSYEDNDSYTTAYDLSSHEGEYLSAIDGEGIIMGGDPDYYEISVPDREYAVVTCDSGQMMVLLNSSGAMIDYSFMGDDLTWVNNSGSQQTYYIAVLAYFGGATASYDLMWESTPLPADDNYEENDDVDSAYDLSGHDGDLLSTIDGAGVLIREDPDYYEISVPSNKMVTITCSFDDTDNPDVGLQLLDSSGDLILSDYSYTTFDMNYCNTTGTAQIYYIRVSLYGPISLEYDLIWETAALPPDDNYEQNDTYTAAYNISGHEGDLLSTIDGGGIMILGDYDYYRISVPANNSAAITCTFDDSSFPELYLSLLDSSGDEVANNYLFMSGDVVLCNTSGSAQTYYIGVYLDSGPVSLEYDLIWETAALPPDDNYEQNDTLETAYDLTGYEGALLSSIDGSGVLINGDTDYYEVFVGNNEQLTATCSFNDSTGPLVAIAIFDSSYDFLDMGFLSETGTATWENTTGSGQTCYIGLQLASENISLVYNLSWVAE